MVRISADEDVSGLSAPEGRSLPVPDHRAGGIRGRPLRKLLRFRDQAAVCGGKCSQWDSARTAALTINNCRTRAETGSLGHDVEHAPMS